MDNFKRDNINDFDKSNERVMQDKEAEKMKIHQGTPGVEQNIVQSNQKQNNKKGLPPILAGILGATIASSAMLGGFLFANTSSPDGVADASETAIAVNHTSQNDVTAMVQEAKQSVVGITAFQTNVDDALGRLLGESVEQSSPQTASSGSGIIYKIENNNAYIVTNHHVVDGAQQLEVTLEDGTSLHASLVGSDQWMDLAVLQVDGSKIENVATLGDSDNIITGQPVIAIGNSLGFLSGTVTQGIVSSTERLIPVDVNGSGTSDWEAQVIQTDAAINPGNSGGALLNAGGEVIGINSSKIAGDAIEGLGFAIPINAAIPVLEQLQQNGEVDRAQMGVQLVELSQVPSDNRTAILNLPENVENGLVVAAVNGGSAAAAAGLQQHDVIVDIDGNQMDSMLDLRKYLFEEREVGDNILITYYRDGQRSTTSLTLESSKNL